MMLIMMMRILMMLMMMRALSFLMLIFTDNAIIIALQLFSIYLYVFIVRQCIFN